MTAKRMTRAAHMTAKRNDQRQDRCGERGLGKSSLTMNKVQSLFYFTHFYDPNWPPKTTFKQLVKLMVEADYGKVERSKGRRV